MNIYDLYCEIPRAYINYIGIDGINCVYEHMVLEAGCEVTAEDIMRARRYPDAITAAKKLGVDNVTTWDELEEWFPVLERMDNGDFIVIAERPWIA